MEPMQPVIDEIADGIYRIATFIPEVSPEGFTFNQFLIAADEPLLFHTGHAGPVPAGRRGSGNRGAGGVAAVDHLRPRRGGRVRGDEHVAAAAPASTVAHGALGCDVSLNDLCDRPPRALADGEVIDLGGKRVRQISTPHVPHGWEAQVLFEETTGTLLCGDLFSQLGAGKALTSNDVVGPAIAAEEMFHASTLAPQTATIMRELGDLRPTHVGDHARLLVHRRLPAGAVRPGEPVRVADAIERCGGLTPQLSVGIVRS